MDATTWRILLVNFIADCFNTIFALICIFAFFKQKSLPRNLTLLFFAFVIFLGAQGLLRGISNLNVLITKKPIFGPIPTVWAYMQWGAMLAYFSIRFILCGTVIERTYATVNLEEYEKHGSKKITCFLIVFLVGGPVTVTLLNSTQIFAMFFMLFSWIVLIISIFVIRWNKKLHRRRLDISVTLSQRHQISENIQVLNTIFPMLLLEVIASILISSTVLLAPSGVFGPMTSFIPVLIPTAGAIVTNALAITAGISNKTVLRFLLSVFLKKQPEVRPRNPNEGEIYFTMLKVVW